MQDIEDSRSEETRSAFSSFRALNEGDAGERETLFRHLGQLFALVSSRCEAEQVEQYDEVLCRLMPHVSLMARVELARLLAPLEQAPATALATLAGDAFEVAKPVLETSRALGEDRLVEITRGDSEAHRIAIAGRPSVTPRLAEAISAHGGQQAVLRLLANAGAQLDDAALVSVGDRAGRDPAIAAALAGRAAAGAAVPA